MKLVLASLLFAGLSWASSPAQFFNEVTVKVLSSTVEAQNLDWKQGDTNSYELNMGFIKGSMVQTVREISSEGIWMDQNIDIMGQKQTASTLIDPATGEIKKMIVNGKEQKVPEAGEQEIVEVKEDKVTVPAGTFDCIHAKIKDKKSGDISQAWINPEKVSMGGALKMIQPSQFGEITISLKSYKRN